MSVDSDDELRAKLGYAESLFASAVKPTDIPSSPGVFVWYHDSDAFFVGAAQDLCHRIYHAHLQQSASARSSALKRTAADLLGFANKAELRNGHQKLTREDSDAVDQWLRSGHVAFAALSDFRAAYEALTYLERQYLGTTSA